MRLVVYAGAPRARDRLYNEKVLAGLGKGIGEGKLLPEKGRARALRALRRFRRLARRHERPDDARRRHRGGPRSRRRGGFRARSPLDRPALPDDQRGRRGPLRRPGRALRHPGRVGTGRRPWRRQSRADRSRRRQDARGPVASARRAARAARCRRPQAGAADDPRRASRQRARWARAALLPGRRIVARAGADRHGADRLPAADHPRSIGLSPARVRELGRITAREGDWASAAPEASHATTPVAAMLLDAAGRGNRAVRDYRVRGRHSRRAALLEPAPFDAAGSTR